MQGDGCANGANLEDALLLEGKPEKTSTKDWDKMIWQRVVS